MMTARRIDDERPQPVRALLLSERPSARLQREAFVLNGASYFAYRAYIRAQKRRPGGFGALLAQLDTTPSGLPPQGADGAFQLPGPPTSPPAPAPAPAPAAPAGAGLGAGMGAGVRPPSARSDSAFSFVGIHQIFSEEMSAVTVLRFARENAPLFAYGQRDGTVLVCDVGPVAGTGRCVHKLKGHRGEITDLDWATSDSFLLSASADGTVHVWDAFRGTLARVITETPGRGGAGAGAGAAGRGRAAPAVRCVRFHPANNNLLLLGGAACQLTVLNFSTGKIVARHGLGKPLRSLACDPSGQLLYVGDEQGSIHMLSCDPRTGVLRALQKLGPPLQALRTRRRGQPPPSVGALHYRAWCAALGGPALLVAAAGATARLYAAGYASASLRPATAGGAPLLLPENAHAVRAAFCPLLVADQSDAEYIVTGAEDGSIYIFDVMNPGRKHINRLQGHASAVMDVAWNLGSDFMASADADGTVIVWRRDGTVAAAITTTSGQLLSPTAR